MSSTDDILRVRIASAACKAVAKSNSLVAGEDAFGGVRTGIEELGPGKISESMSAAGIALAARASGTVARKSRRFIRGMVNDERPAAHSYRSASCAYLKHSTR